MQNAKELNINPHTYLLIALTLFVTLFLLYALRIHRIRKLILICFFYFGERGLKLSRAVKKTNRQQIDFLTVSIFFKVKCPKEINIVD